MPKLLPNTAENFLKNTNLIRLNMLKMIFNGKTGTGHIGSSLSIAEIIFYLFKNIIYKDKKKKHHFILSKGHAVPILYSMIRVMLQVTEPLTLVYRDILIKLNYKF